MRVGQELEEAIARGALVLGVGVGVQEADGDRLDALRAAGVGDGVELGELEWNEDVAVAVDTLAHLEAQPPRHERLGLAADEVVHVGPVPAADLEHVAEAARGDERGQGTGALGQRVDDDRRAVDEVLDVLERDIAGASGWRARPRPGAPGVVDAFAMPSSRVSVSKKTRSVNVPPMSVAAKRLIVIASRSCARSATVSSSSTRPTPRRSRRRRRSVPALAVT